MQKKRRPITTAIKYTIMAYILYVAGNGCYNFCCSAGDAYDSGKEKVDSAIETLSKPREMIMEYRDKAVQYLTSTEQKNTPQPSQLEKTVE
ncbi:hypothetical protein ACFLZ6_01645 [Nanoarchaeota archaeon]